VPGGTTAVPTRPLSHDIRRRLGAGLRFLPFLSFVCRSLSDSFPLWFPWCAFHLLKDRPGRRAKGDLQRAAIARTADGIPG